MGPIGCPETSVINYHYLLSKNPEEHSSHFLRGGSLKSHMDIYMESFKYLGSILTNDGRCTCEIKCRTAMVEAAFNKKRALFTSTLDFELRKKLVKCYIWSIALYGTETWTLRAVRGLLEKYPTVFFYANT